jgi:hypothetical protein
MVRLAWVEDYSASKGWTGPLYGVSVGPDLFETLGVGLGRRSLFERAGRDEHRAEHRGQRES